MILCRSCGRISTGDPKFCEHCGKSFNATICPSKHESSITASHCSTCGSTELSEPTCGVRLSSPNRLVAIVIGLVLLWALTPFLPAILKIGFQVIGWIFCAVFAPLLGLMLKLLLPLLIVWGVIGIFLQIISGERVSLYRVYVALTKQLADLFVVGVKLSGEFLIRLVLARRKRE